MSKLLKIRGKYRFFLFRSKFRKSAEKLVAMAVLMNTNPPEPPPGPQKYGTLHYYSNTTWSVVSQSCSTNTNLYYPSIDNNPSCRLWYCTNRHKMALTKPKICYKLHVSTRLSPPVMTIRWAEMTRKTRLWRVTSGWRVTQLGHTLLIGQNLRFSSVASLWRGHRRVKYSKIQTIGDSSQIGKPKGKLWLVLSHSGIIRGGGHIVAEASIPIG